MDGVSNASAAPNSAVHKDAPEKPDRATKPAAQGVAELKRQKEPNDKRVEPVVRIEVSDQNSASINERRLSISRDDNSQRFVFRGVNAKTGEVERQFPSDADLKRSAMLRNFMGRLIDRIA